MSITLGDAIGYLDLDTTGFTDGIKHAGESLGGFGSKVSSVGKSLSSGLATAGGLAVKGVGAIAGAAGAAGAALLALEDKTEDYRIAMGKLNTAFETSAVGAEHAKDVYNGFYQILGDTDTATEASQLLARLAKDTGDAATWIDIAAGAYGTFGDSLPIEGLIESSNETAKVGQVTGVLADALNWVGISEDEFNVKLAACNSESERANLIMNTLSETYMDASEAFYENNEALVAARMAQAQLDESLATLGQSVSEVKTKLIAEFMPSIAEVTSGLAGMLTGVEGADEQFSAAIGDLITKATDKLPEFLDFGVQILTSILNGLIQNLPMIVSAIPTVISSIITALQQMFPSIIAVGSQILEQIANGIVTYVPQLILRLPDIILSIIDFLIQNLPTFYNKGLEALMKFADGIIAGIPELVPKLSEIITTITTFVSDNLPTFLGKGAEILSEIANGIIAGIPGLVGKLPEIVTAITTFVSDNLPAFLEKGVEILSEITNGIIDEIPGLVEKLPEIITTITTFIADNLPVIFEAGAELLLSIASGILENIPKIAASVPEIVGALVNGFGNVMGSIIEIGKNIVEGIWKGITGAAGWLTNKVAGFVDGIKNVFTSKEGFDTHSPSKWAEEVATNVDLGFANVFGKEDTEAEKAAKEYSQGLMQAATEWVNDKKFYDDLTLEQENDFWKAMLKNKKLAQEDIEKINKKIYTVQKELQEELEQKEQEMLKTQQEAIEEYKNLRSEYDNLISSRAASISGFAGIFDEVEEKAEVSSKQLVENLRGQVEALQGWSDNINKLQEKGVTGPLLEELRELGPNASAEIEALTRLTEKQLEEYQELFNKKLQLAEDQAIFEQGTFEKYILGKDDGESIKAIGSTIATAVSEGFETKSQEVFEEQSEKATEFLADEIDANQSIVVGAGSNVIEFMQDGMEKTFPSLQSYVENIITYLVEKLNRITSLVSQIEAAKSANAQASGISGSHKNGLDYVPYDGYVAELHEGERVLTKEENKDYSNQRSSGGDTYNFYSPKAITPREARRQLKKAKRDILGGYA